MILHQRIGVSLSCIGAVTPPVRISAEALDLDTGLVHRQLSLSRLRHWLTTAAVALNLTPTETDHPEVVPPMEFLLQVHNDNELSRFWCTLLDSGGAGWASPLCFRRNSPLQHTAVEGELGSTRGKELS